MACHRDRVSGCSRPESYSITHHRGAEQMTHKLQNDYAKEILALLRKSQYPQQISQPGDPEKGLRTPREFNVGGQWDLITEFPQDWGNRIVEGINKTFCTPGAKRKEQCPQKTESDLPVGVQESHVEAWVNSLASGQTTGTKHSPSIKWKIGLNI